MSLLIKRHPWSANTNIHTETSVFSDSTSLSEYSPSEVSTNYSKPIRHLFLVRHGQYQRYRTEFDGHLTAKGQKQAWYAANFLISQLPENVLFDSLTHSDSKIR